MELLEKNKEKLVLREKLDMSLANAVRRSVLEIPVLAIDEVEIYKNDSVLYDEIIAHRLGLIPLKTDKGFVLREKCSCKGKGCAKCSVQLKIQAKGPGTVYSKDLKGKAEVIYDQIPIVILKEDQELEIVAEAKLGKGLEHAKFSPGLVYYRTLAEIEISKECDSCKKCVEACPKRVLTGEKKLETVDVYKCDMCEACVETCKKHGKDAIKIKPSEEIIFTIESWGQMEAKEILTGAIKALKENLKELEK